MFQKSRHQKTQDIKKKQGARKTKYIKNKQKPRYQTNYINLSENK